MPFLNTVAEKLEGWIGSIEAKRSALQVSRKLPYGKTAINNIALKVDPLFSRVGSTAINYFGEDVDPAVVKAIHGRFSELAEKYPHTAANIGEVGVYNFPHLAKSPQGGLSMITGMVGASPEMIKEVAPLGIKPGDSTPRIILNLPSIMNATSDFSRIRVGQGTQTVSDVLTHEFGHHVHGEAFFDTAYGHAFFNYHMGHGEESLPNFAAMIRSEYAAVHPMEGFAEAFLAHEQGYEWDPVKGMVEDIASSREKGLEYWKKSQAASIARHQQPKMPMSFAPPKTSTATSAPFYRQNRLPLSDEEWYKASSVYSVRNRVERKPNWTIRRKLPQVEQLTFPSIIETDPTGKRILSRMQAHNAAIDHLTFRK